MQIYQLQRHDNCELNDKIRENSTSANFKARENWVYLSTDYNTTKVCTWGNVLEISSYRIDFIKPPGYLTHTKAL